MAYAKILHVLLSEVPVAIIRQHSGGRLSLSYTMGEVGADHAQSLSLSLPYTQQDHTHRPVQTFITGLLPENRDVLEGWASEFGVKARNPFALLAHMGEDCAGAVQFVREDRLPDVLRGEGTVNVLSEREISEALARIRDHAPPWPDDDRTKGMFSLAGAQAKLALARTSEGWGRPSGKAASTHIIKPPSNPRLPGIEINEHVCLTLARRLGIPAALSEVQSFGGETALVVERFDRRLTHQGATRLHQEDTCQALGIPPSQKYQSRGGPGFPEMVALTRSNSANLSEDLSTIFNAAAFNWIIGGTDAHAKNYSWYIAAGDQIRMTPLYDLISSLPYYDMVEDDLRMAMTIGGEARFLAVRRENWHRFAEELEADGSEVVQHVSALAEQVIPAVADVAVEAAESGLDPEFLEHLSRKISERAEMCAAIA